MKVLFIKIYLMLGTESFFISLSLVLYTPFDFQQIIYSVIVFCYFMM